MPPVNANLDSIVLPTREATQFTKVLIIGDSQTPRTPERWVGQVQKWDMQHQGAFVHSVNNSAVGQYFDSDPGLSDYGATITRNQKIIGDDWGDGNTGDHLQHSHQWDVSGTISPNFSQLGIYGLTAGGFTNALDLDTRKNARLIIRDAAGTFARVRLTEHRGGTDGNSDDFGISGDPVEFDASGALRVLNWPIREAGSLGSASGSPVGVSFKDSNNLDTNRDVQVLGTLIYNSASGESFPSTGLLVANVSRSSWAADDLVSSQSAAARAVLAEAAEGFDLIIIALGHNAESSGTFSDNIAALISAWNTAHTAGGFDAPDVLLIAPWAASGTDMSESKAEDLYDLAIANDYGFISLWDAYEGSTPHGRSERLDGVSASYVMDPVHPDDATTAEAIAKDIEFYFDPDNFAAPEPAASTVPRQHILSRPFPSETKL